MAEIGAYEAKTHLPRLLERVQQGERFIITKHGRPIAELVPFSGHDVERIRGALLDIRSVRKSLARRKIRIKAATSRTHGFARARRLPRRRFRAPV